MKFARTPLFRYALALLGLIFGARKIVQDIHITDFPIDMVVYREGVKAFLEHRSVYPCWLAIFNCPLFIRPLARWSWSH